MQALQVIIVLVSSWNSQEGVLFAFERRTLHADWELVLDPIEVHMGENGMAWGLGQHEKPKEDLKKEGDRKSPAGVFALGPAFGDLEHKEDVKNMPFLLIDDQLECVDDPSSSHYNTFVDGFVEKDWKSSEKMKEIGSVYSLGIVIQHNSHPVEPFAGSCIFMHIGEEATAGCTALSEEKLQQIVHWLDEKKNPLVIQLPFSEYEAKQLLWDLPSYEKISSALSSRR